MHTYRSSCTVPALRVRFWWKFIFFGQIFENIVKHQISWKSVQWEPSCSMRTDGRKDRHDEANSCFSQFCELSWKSLRLVTVYSPQSRYSPQSHYSPQPTVPLQSTAQVPLQSTAHSPVTVHSPQSRYSPQPSPVALHSPQPTVWAPLRYARLAVFWTRSGTWIWHCSYLLMALFRDTVLQVSVTCHVAVTSCNLATAATSYLFNGRSVQSKQRPCCWPSLDKYSVRALCRLGAGTLHCKLLGIPTV